MSVGAPRPSIRSARSIVPWRFAPTTTRIARRARQPVALDVPAGLREHVLARRGERREVRHLPPVTKPNEACAGRPSSSIEPRAGDLLDHGG